MDWGLVILAIEILLLVAGWLLFQQAKTELTARAAEAPVLTQVQDLQRSVLSLIEQLKLESTQASVQLEARCLEARDLLGALERTLETSNGKRPGSKRPATMNRPQEVGQAGNKPAKSSSRRNLRSTVSVVGADPRQDSRYATVYALADDGIAPASIARESGYTEGEIELILGLRQKDSGRFTVDVDDYQQS